MGNKYGQFSKDGSEFIINTPTPPRPWVNHLTNGDYGALCSHAGGGFAFYLDHRLNSVLRRDQRQHMQDMPGRLIYIKDEDSGQVWTANVHPYGKSSRFQARHGMGYTIVTSAYRSIAAEMRFFVPPGRDAEMWDVTLTNKSKRARRLSVYSYCDVQTGNVSLEELEPTFMPLMNHVEHDDRSLVFTKRWWHTAYGWHESEGSWPYRIVVTSSVKPARMLCDRNVWFGPFRSFHNPVGLEGELLPDGGLTSGKELSPVFQWRIELRAGESWKVQQAIAVQADADNEPNRQAIAELQQPQTYLDAWDATGAFWKELFGSVMVKTPDENINVMMNWWNKYQLMVNFFFGRGPSYFHKGQHPAMRDCSQDAFGVIPLAPERARKNLLRIGGFFFADGKACGSCNRMGVKEGPSIKVDLPLWFTLAVTDYLRETGDMGFLDEQIPLLDGGSSTVYQKMVAGIDRTICDRGPHGLPLIGQGDWNDAANAIGPGGKGESVWLAKFLYFVIHEIKPLMELRGDVDKLGGYLQRAEEIKCIVNETCWDGQWFVRAFKDDGTPVGVAGQKEGFIWINSNTWAVISGISTPERLNACMDSVEKHMGTEYGLMNIAPAYTQPDETIGLITRFRAGWKENAAVFSHASSFNVVARAMLGRGADAVDLWTRIMPCNKDQDTYKIEPYVYAQFCAGPASTEFGLGAYHWMTGTAAWMFRAMTDYIIGVHPELDGLRIRPAVDPGWKKFAISRKFRGAVYDIEFSNPDGVQTGVKLITIDGRKVQGTLLPPPTGQRHKVKVVMG